MRWAHHNITTIDISTIEVSHSQHKFLFSHSKQQMKEMGNSESLRAKQQYKELSKFALLEWNGREFVNEGKGDVLSRPLLLLL